MEETNEKEALRKAAFYCSKAEHCTSEVSDKLSNWGIEPEGIARIIEQLIKEKYIDDTRYCQFFIHDKLKYNKWGRNKIAQALWQKRISSDISDPLLNEIDPDEYQSILRGILDSKRKTIQARNDNERRGKLVRFAIGRGFEMSEIYKVLTSLSSDEQLD